MNDQKGRTGKRNTVRRSAEVIDLAERRESSVHEAARRTALAEAVDRVLNSMAFERLIRAIIRQNNERERS